MRLLMSNYDNSVRPAKSPQSPLDVSFNMALTQIIDVVWLDAGLVWNPSDYSNITVIRIPSGRVWKPDILLYNNADSQYSSAVLSTNVIVTSDGQVTYLSSAIFKSSCQINVEFFPFDEQVCVMKFASWTYGGYQVNLTTDASEGDLSNYVTNGEWDLIRMKVDRNVQYYSCCDEPYPDITYTIILRRRPLFYVFNLILPCVLITGVALLSFYMPSDSGEKVTLGITTLLSMTVFLMVIGESMPPTSEKLPLIGKMSFILPFLTLETFLLHMTSIGMRGREVPAVVKRIVFGFLAKMMWIHLDPPDHVRYHPGNPKTPFSAEMQLATLSCQDDVIRRSENGGTSPLRLPRRHVTSTLSTSASNLSSPDAVDCFERQFLRVLNKVYSTIEKNEVRLHEQDRRDTIKLEWQQVALVIDRLLLWVFIVSTIGATFGILYMSPHTKLFTL
ncbi:unnamed protein product [Notodromas monacha]|uniref:Uncharacterized protein n=1 Tax=Notodromas monacha TaxID=399045 RepID=A0A7R9GHI7_9CRUS|nr:unnamed protein product [Notodromas monacha]CAG0921526.1 unnamed protein product [Notodromas monacha]